MHTNARTKDWFIGLWRGAATGPGWGAAWVPLALLIGLIVDSDDSMDEPWLTADIRPENRRRRQHDVPRFSRAGA